MGPSGKSLETIAEYIAGFPLDRRMPVRLITEIVRFRLKEARTKAGAGKKRR